MVRRDSCPTEHALLDIVAERRVGELASHLDTCDDCREVVAELARSERVAIGRFEIEQVLGTGAMGVVYLARDPELERKVALKVLHAPSAARLVEEARVLARLDSDYLVRVYEIEEVDGQLAIAMEYLPGGTLRAWLATPRSWRAVATVMLGVARGLAALHAAGLLHRDLKPDNILFDASGRARIADLGLASLRGAGGVAGTPAYMAPELLAGGAVDERSDQWSFFVCCFEALCGSRPAEHARPGRGPRALQALIARGLERDPAKRHASMTDVVSALERILRPRSPWLAISVLGLGAGAVVVATSIGTSQPPPCERAADPIASVWNAAARVRLVAVYRAHDMAATGAVVTRGLDDTAAAWGSAQTESCRATHVRGEQSAVLLDQRTACLRERLASIEILVDQLATAPREKLARGGEAVAALPAIDECEPQRLGTQMASSDPRAVAARIELARARALRPLGEGRKSLAMVEPLIALGTELRDHSLVAEAKLVAADALADDLQLDRARARFTETELAAEAARDDDLRARALIAHASLAGALQQKPDEADQLLTRARAVVDRLGGRADLQRRVLVAEAALAAARGDQAGGEKRLREALRTLPTTGSERAMRVVALRDLANMLSEQGRHVDAAAAAREAVAFAEATFGPDHVDVSETLSLLALTLHFVGDHDDEAKTLAARAIAIKERARGPEHVSLSSTLMVQAVIARDAKTATGHADARRATDRAIALRRAAYGNDNPLVLALVSERGSLAVEAGEHTLARASFAEALPVLERAWGATSPAVTNARQSQAIMAEHTGDPASCAQLLSLIKDPPAEIRLHRVHCLLAARSLARAATELDALAAQELDRDTRNLLDVLAARIAFSRGDRARARTLLAAVDRSVAEPDPDLALDLASAWALLADHDRAAALAERAVANAGVDLLASELYARAAEIAVLGRRHADAARLVDRAVAIARGASAGPDLLARYRAIAADAQR